MFKMSENDYGTMNLFQTIHPLGRSAPISVNTTFPGCSNKLFERTTSPQWEGVQSGYSSGTSPPASSSSSLYGYSKSSEDLSVDVLISNLIKVVNGEKYGSSNDIQVPLVNDYSNHTFRDCTDPYCELCLATRQSLFQNTETTIEEAFLNFNNNNSPSSNASTPPTAKPPNSPPDSSFPPCDIHNEPKKKYCQTCCNAICKQCQKRYHSDHTTMHVMKAIECAGVQCSQVVDDLRTHICLLMKDLEMLQIAADNLEHKAHEATTDVLMCMQRAAIALEAREKELLGRIEKMRLVKHAVLKLKDDKIRSNISKLLKATESLSDAKAKARENLTPLPLLVAKDMMSGEIFDATSNRPTIPLQDENWISFSGSEANVLETIATLGTIIVSPPGSIGDGRALKGRGNSPQMIQQNQHQQQQQQQQQQQHQQQQQQQQGQIVRSNSVPRGRPILCHMLPIVVTSGSDPASQPPQPSCIIGSDAEMADNLCRPWGVTCDSDGHIIIADRSNNRIQIYKEDGTFVRRFGTHGTGPGQFDRPAGVAVDARRRIIVADKDNHRIQILTMDGVYLLSFGEKGSRSGQFNYPWDVAANSECQIVVSDTRNHRIQMFSPEGVFLRKYGFETSPSMWKHFDSPRGVAFNPNGEVVTTDFNNHRLVVIDPNFINAKVVGYDSTMGIKQFLRPQGLVVDDNGNIIVSDSRNHRIQVLDSDGNLKWKFGSYGKGPDELDRPSGIALTSSGRIVVVDFGNNRVIVY